MEGGETMEWEPVDPFKMCLLILTIDKKRKGRGGTQRVFSEHFSKGFNLKEDETHQGLQEIH